MHVFKCLAMSLAIIQVLVPAHFFSNFPPVFLSQRKIYAKGIKSGSSSDNASPNSTELKMNIIVSLISHLPSFVKRRNWLLLRKPTFY